MFASKTTKVNKTPIQAAPTTSMPQYALYPYPFPLYNYNSSPKFPSPSNYNNSQTVNSSIPKIQRFLEDLDEEFGVGKFTCYTENFINESIDVLDILELKESDFDKLGITNIGIKTKLVRKAKQYCR
jgi:hypothetical protein